jgi:hypothetical protein
VVGEDIVENLEGVASHVHFVNLHQRNILWDMADSIPYLVPTQFQKLIFHSMWQCLENLRASTFWNPNLSSAALWSILGKKCLGPLESLEIPH